VLEQEVPVGGVLPHIPGDLKQSGDPCCVPAQAHVGGLDVACKGRTEGD